MTREEAIHIVKTTNDWTELRAALQELVPELKESEDENIRKELLENFKNSEDSFYMVLTPHKRESIIAWLEKQGGQKSEWSEKDEECIKGIRYYLGVAKAKTDSYGQGEINSYINWLKSLRPQKQWKPSEEMLEALYRAIPENTMAISEDEMLLDKLYQGLKYGRVLSNN